MEENKTQEKLQKTTTETQCGSVCQQTLTLVGGVLSLSLSLLELFH
jgi:hypothetical protein